MIRIDGSKGEGGGQVLRTCLSLSALTGRPFEISKIRANRSKPGLRPQHLTAVRAVATLCKASVTGDELDSTRLRFEPNSAPIGGSYLFDVAEASPSSRSAGSVTLILQAMLWPLLFASEASEIILRGGTFVPFSPPYHYLSQVALPAFARLGVQVESSLNAWGWMADGGGEMQAIISPVSRLDGQLFQPAAISKVEGIAAVTNLPSHIPHRMARRAHNILSSRGFEVDIQPVRARGAGPGAGIALWLPQAGFSTLGRKGLPADKVAEAATGELLSFDASEVAVDRHLADQLILPMVLANGRSSLTTDRITQHTLTVISIARQWLDARIEVTGELDSPGRVSVSGTGYSASKSI